MSYINNLHLSQHAQAEPTLTQPSAPGFMTDEELDHLFTSNMDVLMSPEEVQQLMEENSKLGDDLEPENAFAENPFPASPQTLTHQNSNMHLVQPPSTDAYYKEAVTQSQAQHAGDNNTVTVTNVQQIAQIQESQRAQQKQEADSSEIHFERREHECSQLHEDETSQDRGAEESTKTVSEKRKRDTESNGTANAKARTALKKPRNPAYIPAEYRPTSRPRGKRIPVVKKNMPKNQAAPQGYMPPPQPVTPPRSVQPSNPNIAALSTSTLLNNGHAHHAAVAPPPPPTPAGILPPHLQPIAPAHLLTNNSHQTLPLHPRTQTQTPSQNLSASASPPQPQPNPRIDPDIAQLIKWYFNSQKIPHSLSSAELNEISTKLWTMANLKPGMMDRLGIITSLWPQPKLRILGAANYLPTWFLIREHVLALLRVHVKLEDEVFEAAIARARMVVEQGLAGQMQGQGQGQGQGDLRANMRPF